MKEYLELRILRKFASPLFGENEGVNLSDLAKKVIIATSMPIMEDIRKHSEYVRKSGGLLFVGWKYHREYTAEEIENAEFFQIRPQRFFEPSAEECMTKPKLVPFASQAQNNCHR